MGTTFSSRATLRRNSDNSGVILATNPSGCDQQTTARECLRRCFMHEAEFGGSAHHFRSCATTCAGARPPTVSKQNHHRQGTNILVHGVAFRTGLRVRLVIDKPTGRLPDFRRPHFLALQHNVPAHAARLLRWHKGRRRRGFRKRLSTALFENPLQCLVRREDEGRFILGALVTELGRPVQSLELYGDVLRSVEVRQFWRRLMPCKEKGHHLFRIARQEVGQRVHRFRSGGRDLEWSARGEIARREGCNPEKGQAAQDAKDFPCLANDGWSMYVCDYFTLPTSNIQQDRRRVEFEAG